VEEQYERKMIEEWHEDARGGRLGVAHGIVIYKRRFLRTRSRSEAFLFIIIAADVDG